MAKLVRPSDWEIRKGNTKFDNERPGKSRAKWNAERPVAQKTTRGDGSDVRRFGNDKLKRGGSGKIADRGQRSFVDGKQRTGNYKDNTVKKHPSGHTNGKYLGK